MTSEQTHEGTLIIRAGEDEYYAIPQAVMEQGRLPAERTAELDARRAAGEVTGLAEGVLLPWRDEHYYALPPEVIKQHRVSADRVAEAEALRSASADDTMGFWLAPPAYVCSGCGRVILVAGFHTCLKPGVLGGVVSPSMQTSSVTFSAALTTARFP